MDLLIEMTKEVSEDFWVGFQYLIWVMLYVKCQLYIWVAMSSWQYVQAWQDVQVSQRLKVLLLITDSIFQLLFPSYCVLVLFSGELWKYFETTLFIKNSWLLYQAKFSKFKKILCGGFMLFSFFVPTPEWQIKYVFVSVRWKSILTYYNLFHSFQLY